MVHAGNPVVRTPGMVVFLHMVLIGTTAETAITPGRNSIYSDAGPKSVSALPLELVTL